MVRLLRLYQGGGMGPGLLPDAGGVMDQSVLMLTALDMMVDFDHRLRDEKTGHLLNEYDRIDPVEQRKAEVNSAATWGVTL